MPIKTSSPFTQTNLPVLNARPAQSIDLNYEMPELRTGGSNVSMPTSNSFTSGESDLLGIGLGTASNFVGPKGIEDPNFTGKFAQKKALEFAGKGAQFGGPVGAFAGAVGGLGYGLIKGQDIKADYLISEENKKIQDQKYKIKKREYDMMKENEESMTNQDPSSMTMEKPLKQLSPYTASYSAYNMSAKQASVEPMMQKLSGASTLSPVNNLGMQSVKYGLDDNPEITAADPKAKFIAKNKK
jgi:hypothetical protein